jgi:hypothetical protein
MAVTYRNTKTGRTTTLGEPSPLMDRSIRWVRVVGEVEDVEPGAGEAAPEVSPAPFDPADHTVGEVNAHLDEVDADERARVLRAEAAGKNRRGIVAGPHADEDPDEDPGQ